MGGWVSKGSVIGFIDQVFFGAKCRINSRNIITILGNVVGVDVNTGGIGQNIPDHRIGYLNGVGRSACSGNGDLVRLGSTEFVFVKPRHIAASIGRQ